MRYSATWKFVYRLPGLLAFLRPTADTFDHEVAKVGK